MKDSPSPPAPSNDSSVRLRAIQSASCPHDSSSYRLPTPRFYRTFSHVHPRLSAELIPPPPCLLHLPSHLLPASSLPGRQSTTSVGSGEDISKSKPYKCTS
ncbi:hypothetical protein ILYODFUR_032358 [Ilyodon furcidens]|uniref:Uncharacterized protein n=1 Tax=Ilyodon furcidens TaxID=33524 RepID=A0ABV0T2H1_9TELE